MIFRLLFLLPVWWFFNSSATLSSTISLPGDTLHYPEEKHFRNLIQLTNGGDNAEAYFSFDGRYIVFQKTNPKEGIACDQIFYGKVPKDSTEKFEPVRISSGKGRTTCPFFTKDNKHIIYASTHLGGKDCPVEPERKPGGKYLWPIYDTYDIFVADKKGKIKKQLTSTCNH